jgi:hypothetical protein
VEWEERRLLDGEVDMPPEWVEARERDGVKLLVGENDIWGELLTDTLGDTLGEKEGDSDTVTDTDSVDVRLKQMVWEVQGDAVKDEELQREEEDVTDLLLLLVKVEQRVERRLRLDLTVTVDTSDVVGKNVKVESREKRPLDEGEREDDGVTLPDRLEEGE